MKKRVFAVLMAALSASILHAAAVDLPETAPKEFREIADHPFFRGYKGLVIERSKKVGNATMFKVYDPNKKITFNLFNIGEGFVVLGEAVGPDGRLMRFMEDKDSSAAQKKPRVDMAKFAPMAAYTVGAGEKNYYLFTDPECPYCRKLENFIARLAKHGRIHVFFFPLDGLHPTARRAAAWLMMQPEEKRQEAMRRIALEGDTSYLDANVTRDALNRIAEQKEIGRELGVNGTPTILDANGAPVLRQLLRESNVTSAEFRNAPYASRNSPPSGLKAFSNPDHIDSSALEAFDKKGATVIMGNGDRDLYIFMSTQCPHCREMFRSKRLASLQEKYRFHFILDPSKDNVQAKYETAYVLLESPEKRPGALLRIMTGEPLSDNEKRTIEEGLAATGDTAMTIAFIGFMLDRLGIASNPAIYSSSGRRMERRDL